jgi:hypothetical protein
MLNQFPRNSRHVSRLRCEDVPIFLEEFDERELLFKFHIIAYVSNLGRLLRGQWNHFAERVLRLDGRLGGLGVRNDWVRGGGGALGQGLLQILELCGRHESIDRLTALLITVIVLLDVSPDGDDTTWPWHVEDQACIMWDCHELGEYWPSQESVVSCLKIGDHKLKVLRAEIFLSPKD